MLWQKNGVGWEERCGKTPASLIPGRPRNNGVPPEGEEVDRAWRWPAEDVLCECTHHASRLLAVLTVTTTGSRMGRAVPASVALVLNALEEVALPTPFVVTFGGRVPGGVQSKRSILNWRAIDLETPMFLI